MKKKYVIIIPVLIIVEVLCIINFVNGFDYNLFSLNTNKTEYYFDESIKINASWELNYNNNNEFAYIQIQITNLFDQFVWNSSKYNQIGTYEKNWTVSIENLNLDVINGSHLLYIKLFVFYCHKDTGSTMYNCLETIEVKVIKRNISCELIEYKDLIKIGEDISLVAKFYDQRSDFNRYLINQTVQFKTSYNDLIIHQCNYTTNISGIISIQLISVLHLKLGRNFLTFSIVDNDLYNNSDFVYEIYVEKNEPIIDVQFFNNNLKESEDLEIKLYCYYYLNQLKNPIASHKLLIKIFDNKSLTFINEYKTNKFGVLEFSVSQDCFNYNQKSHDFIIIIFLNESLYLDNKTFILNLDLYQENYSNSLSALQIRIFSFISVLIIILILLSYLIINKKSKSEKLLTELIIRY